MYALLTSLVVFRGMFIMEWTLRPQLRARRPDLESHVMATLWKMVLTGLYASNSRHGQRKERKYQLLGMVRSFRLITTCDRRTKKLWGATQQALRLYMGLSGTV